MALPDTSADRPEDSAPSLYDNDYSATLDALGTAPDDEDDIATRRWDLRPDDPTESSGPAEFLTMQKKIEEILLRVHADGEDQYAADPAKAARAQEHHQEMKQRLREEAAVEDFRRAMRKSGISDPLGESTDSKSRIERELSVLGLNSSISEGRSVADALEDLRGISKLHDLHKNQKKGSHIPLPHQITGAQWLKSRETLTGCAMLADAVGTGKTLTTTMALVETILEQDEMDTAGGMTLLVVPESVLDECVEELRKWDILEVRVFSGLDDRDIDASGHTFRDIHITKEQLLPGVGGIRFQDANLSLASCCIAIGGKTVVVTTYPTWELRILQNSPGNNDSGERKMKSQFQNAFYRIIFDDAHFLRGGSGGSHFRSFDGAGCVVKWFVSGTPFLDGIDALCGLLEMCWDEDRAMMLLDVSGLSDEQINEVFLPSFDPYDDDEIKAGDPRRLWCLHPACFRHLTENNPTESPKLYRAVRTILSVLLLRRQYSTKIDLGNGEFVEIGEGMPTSEIRTIELQPTDKEQAEYEARHRELSKKVVYEAYKSTKSDRKQRVKTGTGIGRQFVINATSLRLSRLDQRRHGQTTAKDVENWQKSYNKSGMNWLAYETCKKVDPREVPNMELDDQADFFNSLAVGSPCLRALCGIVNDVCIKNHRQLLVFVDTRLSLWFYLRYFRKIGLKVHAITGETPPAERQRIKTGFQKGNSCDILITQYRISSFGINLHKACSDCVLAEAGSSANEEGQAYGSLLRLGQEGKVTIHRLTVIGTFKAYQDLKISEQLKAGVITWNENIYASMIEDAKKIFDAARQESGHDDLMDQSQEERALVLDKLSKTYMGMSV